MGATRALLFGPGSQAGNNPGKALIEEIQKREVGADDLQAGTIFGAIRAQLEDLHDAGIIAAGGPDPNSRNVAHVFGNRLMQGGGGQGPAIGNKKHEERQKRERENEGGHHRGTATRRAGVSRESSVWRMMVSAQEMGRKQPRTGARYCTTSYLGARLRRA